MHALIQSHVNRHTHTHTHRTQGGPRTPSDINQTREGERGRGSEGKEGKREREREKDTQREGTEENSSGGIEMERMIE